MIPRSLICVSEANSRFLSVQMCVPYDVLGSVR